MKTRHTCTFDDAMDMHAIVDNTVDLIVTSPPYPMIAMWDDMFAEYSSVIPKHLSRGQGMKAFELMHSLVLDNIWNECFRVLKSGGIACINIGDATRTLNGHFMLYPNHARILQHALSIGFTNLPCILWRKPTNAPNRFMGSGMLPAGAYVTLEHEYILVLRKGSKREFSAADKQRRRQSAIFWEERNMWFSDVWDNILGARQKSVNGVKRERTAAFPVEIAHRLINMYSCKYDVVLDPFVGTGTTMAAAAMNARHSIGYEIDDSFKTDIVHNVTHLLTTAPDLIDNRLSVHKEFAHERIAQKGPLKHHNAHYDVPIVTAQEKELKIDVPVSYSIHADSVVEVSYE